MAEIDQFAVDRAGTGGGYDHLRAASFRPARQLLRSLAVAVPLLAILLIGIHLSAKGLPIPWSGGMLSSTGTGWPDELAQARTDYPAVTALYS